MADIETHPVYDLEHLPGHREIRRPKYAVKYWPQSETCQRNPRKYTLITKSDNQRTIRNIMRRIDTQDGNPSIVLVPRPLTGRFGRISGRRVLN